MTGRELKAKRKLLGLTQEELALKVGITKQSISNFEKGKKMPIPIERVICYELGKAFIEWKGLEF